MGRFSGGTSGGMQYQMNPDYDNDMIGDQYYDDQVFADMGGPRRGNPQPPVVMPMTQNVEVSPVIKQTATPIVKAKVITP
jgi:hypothetical protein